MSFPPPPPRPDLLPAFTPGDRWRIVDPGRMRAPAVVGAGMRIWAGRWLRWGLVTLLFAGVLSVVLAALDPRPAGLEGSDVWVVDGTVRSNPVEPAAVIVGLVGALLLGPWLYVILARESLLVTFAETSPDPVARTFRGVHSVLWIFLILLAAFIAAFIPVVLVVAAVASPFPTEGERALAIFVPLLVVFVLFLWLVPRLILVIHVFVVEDRRGTKAIAEAWRRTRGAWWMVLGVLVLNVLIGFAISLVPASIASSVFPDATLADAVPRAVVLALTNAVIVPIGFAITSALYLELSARKGLLSQELIARNLARFENR